MAKELKNDIKYNISLDELQKNAKADIINHEIVVIIGRAGSGKSMVCANTALDLLFKKEIRKILVTRPNVETGRSLGFLPGGLSEKVDPYLEAFRENIFNCYSNSREKEEKIKSMFEKKVIDSMPIAFIRGKTVREGEMLNVEESQNLTVKEASSIVSRLGVGGRIVFNGDLDQVDTREKYTGLHYLLDMAEEIPEIKVHILTNNHRSDLVGKILDWEYSRKKVGQTLVS